MATRRERVLLELEDRFTSEMAAAAAQTALLDRNLKSLSGTAVRSERENTKVEKSVRAIGTSSESSGKQIDKLSGRLRLLAQAAAVLGPAMVPLGAPLIGVMAGLTAQLGAVAGAVGVSILAFSGMGDALKAVNEYQLEPTAENLQAMRIEMEKLGPAGADFVRFIDDLGPQLKTLQLTAREGLLPGVEDGINNLLPLLPKVRNIIGDLAEAMGGLAADSGADLAGPEWRSFFDYLDNEAGPLLTEFGNTVGNFAQGFAGLMVGLGPVTRDFSGGLEAMSESFANWSANLGSNDGFQEFIRYVQESGPKAVAFLAELAMAFGSILKAAAPVGDAVLPVLTKMLAIIGDLADSPLGTLFFTAAAAMSVYSRAVALGAAATSRFGTTAATTAAQVTASSTAYRRAAVGAQFLADNYRQVAAAGGMMALAMTDVDDKAGASNTAMLTLAGSMAGPWGAAAGFAAGAALDVAAANNDMEAALVRAQAALDSGDTSQMRTEFARLTVEAERIKAALTIDADTEKMQLLGLLAPGVGVATGGLERIGLAFNDLRGGGEKTSSVLDNLSANMNKADNSAAILGAEMGLTAQQFRVATGGAQEFTGALAEMDGFLSRREALRSYQEELKNFGKALENGFQPKNVEGLDRVAASITNVASQIKNVEVRRDFMANAKASLERFAETGPKAQAAVGKVLDEFVRLGLMEAEPEVNPDVRAADQKLDRSMRNLRNLDDFRATPQADADTRQADRKLTATERSARMLDALTVNPMVNVNNGQALSAIEETRRRLAAFNGAKATAYMTVIRNTIGSGVGPGYNGGGDTAIPQAGGGFVPKTGLPYADRHHYLLADGEGVTTNRNGETDRFRDVVSGINAGYSRAQIKGMLAGGGVVGDIIRNTHARSTAPGDDALIRLRGTALQLSGAFTEAAAATQDATKGMRRSVEDRLELAQAMSGIRDLRRTLAADGKNRLTGLDRKIAQMQLQVAEKELRMLRNREQRAARGAAAGFDLDGGMTRSEVRDEYAEFKRVLREAGVDLPRNFDRIRERSLRLADRFEDVSEKLAGTREELENWRQTAEDVSRQVAGIFDNDIYATGGLAAAMTQLEADRNDTAERDRLLKAIAELGISTDSAAFQSLATSGDMATLRDLDTRAEIDAFMALYDDRAQQQTQAGQWAANAITGSQIASLEATIARQESTLDRLNSQLENQEQRLEAATMRGTRDGAKAGARDGVRLGLAEQQRVQTAKAMSR